MSDKITVFDAKQFLQNYDNKDLVAGLVQKNFKQAGLTKFGKYSIEEYNTLLEKVPFGERSYAKENLLEENSIFNKLRQLLLQFNEAVNTLIHNQLKNKLTEVKMQEKLLRKEHLEQCLEQGTTAEFTVNDPVEQKVEALVDEEHQLYDAGDFKDKMLSVVSVESPPLQYSLTNFKREQYRLEIVKLALEIQEFLTQKAQTSKLIQDAIANKEILEQEIDKLQPFIKKLEENNITSKDEDAIHYSRRFIENCKIKQFLSNGWPVKIATSPDPKDVKVMDACRGLNPEEIKAIFKLTPKAQKKALRAIYLPENLKDYLELDYKDSLESIVDNYKEYID